MIKEVLELPELREQPPVLVDVGASGALHPAWKEIAPYSICIAFDADAREMTHVRNAPGSFRELFVYNRIVSDGPAGQERFYLTKSPFCSSRLRPNHTELRNWAFADSFELVNETTLPTTQVAEILKELKLQRIDWLKIDSQGTDLRLFRNIPEPIRHKILNVEFEPGIINAYQGEDLLADVLRHMGSEPFWASKLNVRGNVRMSQEVYKTLSPFKQRHIPRYLPIAPAWVEINYTNNFQNPELNKRDFLLGWVFSTLLAQHGFALQLAQEGQKRFGDSSFDRLRDRSLAAFSRAYTRHPLYFFKQLVKLLLRWEKRKN